MRVLTRFAPSPTGHLHLGGARTALFNWLYARHYKGSFALRIEDTDQERSTQELTDAIMQDLSWMGLDWDQLVIQSQRQERHKEVAYQLLEKGLAYPCFCSPQELQTMREEAMAKGLPPLYDRRWRNADQALPDAPFSLRLKVPLAGSTHLKDMVQGDITVDHATLDDMILLRSDGTPTYMLAVVVDDHDMGVTHIIRGDDHLTNAFRQMQIYQAMDWAVPCMGHIPLIHGAQGGKLSKREGAAGVETYRQQGILSWALCNALVRLGWAHGNDEKIEQDQAIEWFDGSGLSKSAARFDPDKLMALNAHYLRQAAPETLWQALNDYRAQQGLEAYGDLSQYKVVQAILSALTVRARTLADVDQAVPAYMHATLCDPVVIAPESCVILRALRAWLATYAGEWSADALDAALRDWVRGQSASCDNLSSQAGSAKGSASDKAGESYTKNESNEGFGVKAQLASGKVGESHAGGISFGALAKPLRLALTGAPISPSVTEVMQALGPEWVDARLGAVRQEG